jgi:ERCC4-type nuclease
LLINDPADVVRRFGDYQLWRRLGTISSKWCLPVRIVHGSDEIPEDITGFIRSFLRRAKADEVLDLPVTLTPGTASPLYAVLCHIPGIGMPTAYEISKHVSGLPGLFAMDRRELATLPRVGKKTADKIFIALHGVSESE